MKPHKIWGPLVPLLASRVASLEDVLVHGDGVTFAGVRNTTSTIDSFYGIKYAEAPVGELRWRPPVLVDYRATQGHQPVQIDATTPGNGCVQTGPFWSESLTLNQSGHSEDCLLLNIQVPSKRTSDKLLPVLVNIHGGGTVIISRNPSPKAGRILNKGPKGYTLGTAIDNAGDALVYQSNGSMIYVAVQYRLGPWGFLAGDHVAEDGTPNAGLLDQRAAIEWLRQNIAHFGGDPDGITITGGSAGGGSVTMQMILYGGEEDPPFRAAIPEFPWWTPMFGKDWQNEQASLLLEASGCSNIDCLRSRSTEELLNATNIVYRTAYEAGSYGYGTFYWGPVVDGVIIQDNPVLEFYNGHFTKVPVLITRNGHEGFTFTNNSIDSAEGSRSMLKALWQDSEGQYVDVVRSLYPPSARDAQALEELPVLEDLAAIGLVYNITEEFALTQAIFGDALVNCPTAYVAGAVDAAGLAAFKLIFNTAYQFHGATGAYIYNKEIDHDGTMVYEGLPPLGGNTTLAFQMRDWYISFVVDLDPNSAATTQNPIATWPKFGSTGGNVLYISGDGIEAIRDPDDYVPCHFFHMTRGQIDGRVPVW
ncbi:hypothetical protein jhhlp_004866 [Lomentospora prolificans]|uniref:Carboxylic ester hydrolase n=1 Tax=Lomentospora prolificans TaxID=41688 RepID=A0A2N3N7R1_9PEZI|nr:hypothetical protein jhhlp_004866 [Lomentospora prolificans]